MGDRMFAEYEIINVQKQSGRARANVTVGHYKYDLVRKWKSFNYWYYLGYALLAHALLQYPVYQKVLLII